MSNLTEKTISEILDCKFFIPSYQRGYRWTTRQVEDLLNDIWGFITKPGKDDNEWYCLQPVVVKKINSTSKTYEVLDGQQRLTTIFLILKHLEHFIESERKCFEIEYKTRNTELINSKEFLENIDSKEEIESKTNIDYFHIFQAYENVKDWFQEKAEQGERFITPFLERTKVIWYEVDAEKDAIEIFTRINMGKIPLTNAELIKALFLNSSNFKQENSVDEEKIRLKQLEIASEWDRIEYALQNEELWYFINNVKNELPTRIEYIFNIMKDIEGVKYGNDPYSTFRFFSEKFKSKSKDEIDKNWKEIKIIFQTIEEWFYDRELYHKIGYLITTGEKITKLLKKAKNKEKSEFWEWLNSSISEKVKCDNLEKLKYGNWRIKNILLLHNIYTMLSNKNATSRFPFYRFKKEEWDIEHIHAIATEVKVKQNNQKEWLVDNFVKSEQHNDTELNSKIDAIINTNDTVPDKDDKEIDFESIIEYVLGDEDNSIKNLCLLDKGTNRSYKNDAFKNKRRKIIENEKSGTFIPICTRNIFMKYYSKEPKNLKLWNENDREDYFKNIKTTLYKYKIL